MRISQTHAERYRQYYEAHPVPILPSKWVVRVQNLAYRLKAETILDYGCGPGRGLSRYLTHEVHDYDPGVAELALRPKRADLVVCCHTLEHVEPECLDAVVADLKKLAKRGVFIVVSCEPSSSKVLPDGTPWHTFVRDAKWWKKYLKGFKEQPCLKDGGKEYAALLEIERGA